MPSQHIYISEENYLKLKDEENMSGLINGLLSKHYKEIDYDPKEQAKVLEETKKAIEYENHKADLIRFIDNMTEQDQEEYKQGVKDKKWKSITEFAEIKLNS